ncbi:MAG: threonylcarbamoyl-AMP synthase [Gammaproteobacteria bacterium]|nr:threonylcarbamoyl-AMP synthase [Gammaproteobacteria bacterium]
MTRYFTMHPDNPQPRLIKQAAEALLSGELLAYPTDSGYALGCLLSNRDAVEKLRRLRGVGVKHPFTLLCHSISEASQYCLLNDQIFRIFKEFTPGPYTFIVPATKKVPKPAQGLKRKEVGIRIPEYPIVSALLQALGTPILSTTLWLADDEEPISCPTEIAHKTKGEVDLILDGGTSNDNPSTVVDLLGSKPIVIRAGLGDISPFE